MLSQINSRLLTPLGVQKGLREWFSPVSAELRRGESVEFRHISRHLRTKVKFRQERAGSGLLGGEKSRKVRNGEKVTDGEMLQF